VARVRKIAILDDYLGVALEYGDWSGLPADGTAVGQDQTAGRIRHPASR
jgi:hypothetical protein